MSIMPQVPTKNEGLHHHPTLLITIMKNGIKYIYEALMWRKILFQ